jgi:hypothetical protein
MDSLTIHGAPAGTSRGATIGAMTRAAVIGLRRPVMAEDSATRDPCKDAFALGTAHRTRRAAVLGGTGRIGRSSSSASRLEMPQFVHPPAQPVMARKCEGTDAPGSRPNRNRLR